MLPLENFLLDALDIVSEIENASSFVQIGVSCWSIIKSQNKTDIVIVQQHTVYL